LLRRGLPFSYLRHVEHLCAHTFTRKSFPHDRYVPFLAEIDKIVGRLARSNLAQTYSFLAAFEGGLSPHEALAAAIDRLEDRLYDRQRRQ
jgi:hypothetical protein